MLLLATLHRVMMYWYLCTLGWSGLTKNLNVLINTLSVIELSVNASKCEFLCFNVYSPAPPLHVGEMLLECVSKLKWLGIIFSDTLLTTCLSLVASALQCIYISYGKLLPNRGRCSCLGLCKLHHSFCSPTILSGFQHAEKDHLQLSRGYFKYWKYSLSLSRWYRNHKTVSHFGLINPLVLLYNIAKDMRTNTPKKICTSDPLTYFFKISDSVDIVMLFMLCFPSFFLVDYIILFFSFFTPYLFYIIASYK